MGLHEFGWGGVYISPLFIYALLALGLTALLRLLLQATPLGRQIWHEALFDCALFVLILCGITWALSGTP
ncbi:DUF1656 domain-containing protein [Pseudomonas nicosulfuronedens]|uniref:DUF1656 domain-containing protein n=1 Tax=Pseudomonas nicosulfuronedens TaxID=2571105 RepID=A0A5R9QVW6_9PSED|nr:DUF1656 domain-containing protein [Pseudomonas nicosulfuronedens]MDH1011590.1 DUF1656 domain-containing protein [Pseudomonas nicosulfuronedens]MDH1980420.1 DUF1656 domain-containing protein [Pseudomonas nicosulfuronedens]MDH2029360.1 DUF1656 domain-containing protein [Pseudomonas nicosulfuronedens]TLX74260.1 DUF1656 domain-containing protein [Pseudomonas nicosulfuronedens]